MECVAGKASFLHKSKYLYPLDFFKFTTKFTAMFGNMEEQQKAMKARLALIIVESESGEGAVKVKVNANQEILNISIDRNLLSGEDVTELEDLVTVAVNRALQLAAAQAAAEAKKMLREMMPPGMGGFDKLFG